MSTMHTVYALLEGSQLHVNNPIVESTIDQLDKKLADLAIQIDKLIYLKNQKIDNVVVLRDQFQFNKHVDCRPNSIYFTSTNADGSFYCCPDVLTQISCIYKLDFTLKFPEQHLAQFFNIEPKRAFTNKLMYIIDRLGINIYVG